jgi:hypothetical protein
MKELYHRLLPKWKACACHQRFLLDPNVPSAAICRSCQSPSGAELATTRSLLRTVGDCLGENGAYEQRCEDRVHLAAAPAFVMRTLRRTQLTVTGIRQDCKREHRLSDWIPCEEWPRGAGVSTAGGGHHPQRPEARSPVPHEQMAQSLIAPRGARRTIEIAQVSGFLGHGDKGRMRQPSSGNGPE